MFSVLIFYESYLCYKKTSYFPQFGAVSGVGGDEGSKVAARVSGVGGEGSGVGGGVSGVGGDEGSKVAARVSGVGGGMGSKVAARV
jgi:hypothetical protein